MLREAVGFGRELRRSGLSVDLGAARDYARALGLVDIGDREQVRAAGAAMFVRRHDDLEPYHAAFARWWRRRGGGDWEKPTLRGPATEADIPEEAAGEGGTPPQAGEDRQELASRDEGIVLPSPDEGVPDEGAIEGVRIAPDAYSHAELLRHREFDRMTASELRDAERLIDLLEPRLETRRTRRYELHRHGRLLAPRAMFRRNLGTGGQLVDWEWRRHVRRPRPIVVLCDISGSMERHSRLLLRFVQAMSETSSVHAESFVFGTRLTRVTRLLRDRDRDRALARVAESVTDWAGGTRIGDSFREFNLRWARRTLRTSGVVIVVSDGWDRGDPALVAAETARLRRSCHRLIWLNPLAGVEGYRPLAAGMAAAYPFIDEFVPAGTVASLERLGQLLAGTRESRRGGEGWRTGESAPTTPEHAAIAAAHPHAARPAALDVPGDRTVARPLT
ncbi:MAG TPA: VWA domain-containing protein [Candidatus Dormibacteraeota bacterium]|nr:VWA domain-containing protein [Candidatus Dormibacteraeota bacterium]